MQINRLLQNSVRNELMGSNMFLFSESVMPRKWDFDKMGRMSPANVWCEPEFLMSGRLGLSHECDITNSITLEIYKNGERLDFHSVRNLWTPAFMSTYYRCMPEGDYPRAGLVGVKERKCITPEDCFVSEITLFNDDNESCALEVRVVSTLEADSEPFYKVNAKTLPRGMGRQFELDGSLCIYSPMGYSFAVEIESGASFSFRVASAYAPLKKDKAEKLCKRVILEADPFLKNERRFNEWFKRNVPVLKSENAELLKAYYYRFFLIKKCTFSPRKLIPKHIARGEVFYESATGSWYGCPIGLPYAMQIEEGKWLSDKSSVRSHLDFWLDGYARGYIQLTPHAAWSYYLFTRDKEWLKRSYPKFLEYTFKKLDINDPEKLPVTDGSWPTGAEYQPSFYQHTPTPWDYRYDNRRKGEVDGKCQRLYRLDEISYSLLNVIATANMARELGLRADSEKYLSYALALKDNLKERFFSEKRGAFADIDVASGRMCDDALCYDSFAPLMFGLVDGEKYLSSVEVLLRPDVFESEFYPTSAEKRTPMFWFDNAIVGPAYASKSSPDLYGCCWNGPVWPYAATVTLSALGSAARSDGKYRKMWLDAFKNYTDLHFYLGDFSVPDVVEHYRHTDGMPFSVTHDYFHSSYIDFVLGYYAGISVSDKGKVSFKPLTDEEFEISGVVIGGRSYNFKQLRDRGRLKRIIENN